MRRVAESENRHNGKTHSSSSELHNNPVSVCCHLYVHALSQWFDIYKGKLYLQYFCINEENMNWEQS